MFMGWPCCWQGPIPKAQGKTSMCSSTVQLLHLCGIQVCDVLHGAGVVSIVPLLDHGVKQVSKHLEASGTMYSNVLHVLHGAPATSLAGPHCQCGRQCVPQCNSNSQDKWSRRLQSSRNSCSKGAL